MRIRYSQEILNKGVDELLRQIRGVVDGGRKFLFRGEPQKEYEKTGDLICSGLARNYPDEIKSDYFSLENHVQKRELGDIKNYTDSKDEKTILTEVQHYGGKTSLIDFTEDYNVALFFACDSEAHKDGRIILFDISKKPKDIEIIQPEKALARVVSQKSVFLRLMERNYLHKKDGEEDFITIIPVPSRLKPELIRRLKLYHNITTESIYCDIHGYIKHQAAHQDSAISFYQGIALSEAGRSMEAMQAFMESIDKRFNIPAVNYEVMEKIAKAQKPNKEFAEHIKRLASILPPLPSPPDSAPEEKPETPPDDEK